MSSKQSEAMRFQALNKSSLVSSSPCMCHPRSSLEQVLARDLSTFATPRAEGHLTEVLAFSRGACALSLCHTARMQTPTTGMRSPLASSQKENSMCAPQDKPLRTQPLTSGAAVPPSLCAAEVALEVPHLPFTTIVGQGAVPHVEQEVMQQPFKHKQHPHSHIAPQTKA